MVFNIEYYKKNKLFLLITIISIIVLIMLNTMIDGFKDSESKLEDEEIDVSKLVIKEIMTSNKGVTIDDNASFDLKNRNGKVLLTNKYGIVDEVEYKDLSNGVAYIRENSKWISGINISLGYENDTEGKI